MNKQHLKCLLIITVLLGTPLHASAQNNNTTASFLSSEDVILQWNRVLMGTIRTAGQQPPPVLEYHERSTVEVRILRLGWRGRWPG